jgi:hypothetical protein
MAFGIAEGIGAAGAIGSFLGGRSAAKSQKEMARRQAQTIQMQNQNFRQAQPYFQQALQQAANYAGLGGDGLRQTGESQFQMLGGQRAGLGGNWGNREDQLRLQQGEEDINRRQQMTLNRLRFMLGQRGVAEGSQAAALGRAAAQGPQEFGQFRRGLAINAGQEQERRMQALQQLIAQGFGQGSAASAGYGQQAGMYGQQAAGANQDLGNILQQYMYQRNLGQLGEQRRLQKWWDEDPVFGV